MLGKGLAPPLGPGDELLLIDPPADTSRFVLPERTAILFTSQAESDSTPSGVARVATQPGGVAHIRLGDHLIDLYTFGSHTLVHLPAVALLCSGQFGSSALPVRVGEASDGSDEIEALRLAARLVREGKVRLMIPRWGAPVAEPVAMMERLAEDVAYLHALRRVVIETDTSNGNRHAAEKSLSPARLDGHGSSIHKANLLRVQQALTARHS